MVYYSFSCIPHMEEVSSSFKIFACFKIGYTLYCQAVRSITLSIKYAYPTPNKMNSCKYSHVFMDFFTFLIMHFEVQFGFLSEKLKFH